MTTSSPTGADDMTLVLERLELAALDAALALVEHEELDRGERLANMRLLHRDGSPWLECSAVVTTLPHTATATALDELARTELEHARVVRLALWRRTCDVYRLDEHGAVEDDPIYRLEDDA